MINIEHTINYVILTVPDCTKPAVEEFPDDFLTAEQRKNGGIIIHFIIGIKTLYLHLGRTKIPLALIIGFLQTID